MIIYVDADACPVIKQAEKIAEKYNIETVLICDTNHILESEYSQIFVVDKGADSADFFLVNKCSRGDIAITQDYGVAAMVLSKGGYAINQNGIWYTDENIGQMLMSRHITKKIRRSGKKTHLKGPKKRTDENNKAFEESFERLIQYIGINN